MLFGLGHHRFGAIPIIDHWTTLVEGRSMVDRRIRVDGHGRLGQGPRRHRLAFDRRRNMAVAGTTPHATPVKQPSSFELHRFIRMDCYVQQILQVLHELVPGLEEFPSGLLVSSASLGYSACLAIAAPWYFWVGWRTDGEWLRGFFLEHNLGRAVQSMEGHGGGFWYYPMAALVGMFPNTLLLLPIAIWCVRSSNFWSARSSDYRLGAIWIVVYMLIFSAASTKLPSYITPCYVGAAILFGGFYRNWQLGTFAIPRWLMITATCVMLFIGLGFVIAMIGVEWKLNIRGASYVAIWSIGLFAASFAANQARLKSQQPWVGGWTIAAGAMLIGGLYVHGAPVADRMRTDLDALIAIEAQSATEGRPTAWMAIGTIEPSWVFYLKKTIPEIAMEQTLATGQTNPVALDHSLNNPMARVLGHLEQPNAKLIVDQQGWSLANQLGLQDQEGSLHTELRTMRFGRKQELIVLADDSSPTSTATQVKPENSAKR